MSATDLDGAKESAPVVIERDVADYCVEVLRLQCERLHIATQSAEWKRARVMYDSLRGHIYNSTRQK